MIDHVCLEVSDLQRSARFYDTLFFALGVRRVHSSPQALAYGIDQPSVWVLSRPGARPGNGHVAIAARGRVAVDAAHEAGLSAGGSDDGPPGPRPQRGPRYYAAYLRDPDGLRLEIVSGSS